MKVAEVGSGSGGVKNGNGSNHGVSAEEARAYLESRGHRTRQRHDWATIMRRVMNGESQQAIAAELGTTGAQLSNGLKRFAEKIVRTEETK